MRVSLHRLFQAFAFALMLTAGVPAARANETLAGDMVLGSPGAPHEVIVYLAPTCPHCLQFHREVYPRLRPLVDSGRIRLIYREISATLEWQDVGADQLARCGTTDAEVYVTRLAAIMEAQDDGPLWMPQLQDFGARLAAFAGRFDLSSQQIMDCFNDPAGRARVEIFEREATRLGIQGVPSVVVDGELLPNWTFELIEERLAALDAAH